MHSDITLGQCIFSDSGRAIELNGDCSGMHIDGCTFYGNIWAVSNLYEESVEISNSIITACSHVPFTSPELINPSCCDIYGNENGDWVGMEDHLGVDGNICLDALLCDPEGGDFHLGSGSPCAPFTAPNEECDLIGAWPVGCDVSPVEPVSWGRLKKEFR